MSVHTSVTLSFELICLSERSLSTTYLHNKVSCCYVCCKEMLKIEFRSYLMLILTRYKFWFMLTSLQRANKLKPVNIRFESRTSSIRKYDLELWVLHQVEVDIFELRQLYQLSSASRASCSRYNLDNIQSDECSLRTSCRWS